MSQRREGDPSTAATGSPQLPGGFVLALRDGDENATLSAVRSDWFELTGRCAAAATLALRRRGADQIDRFPVLSMLVGLCEIDHAFDPVPGLRRIARAVTAARDARSGLGAFDRALILSADAARRQQLDSAEQARRSVHAALAHARTVVESGDASGLPLSDLFLQIGISLHYAGDVDLALEAFATGQAVAPVAPNSPDPSEVAGLAAAFGYEGDIFLAERYLAHSRSIVSEAPRDPVAMANDWVAESIITLESFDSTGVLARAEALEVSLPFAQMAAVATVSAVARLVARDAAVGLAELETRLRTIELGSGHVVLPSATAFTRSMLRLSLGDVRVAGNIIEKDFAPGPSQEVARARVELIRGRPGAALRRLAELSTDPLPLRTAAEASAVEVATLLRRKTSARASGAVDYLGALLERTGLRLPVAFLPQSDFDRVMAALHAAGYSGLFEGFPARAVLPDQPATLALTARERTVLAALMDESSAARIATALFVSTNTVKSQLRSIYRKLGAASRQEAIMIAVDRQLLSPADAAPVDPDDTHD